MWLKCGDQSGPISENRRAWHLQRWNNCTSGSEPPRAETIWVTRRCHHRMTSRLKWETHAALLALKCHQQLWSERKGETRWDDTRGSSGIVNTCVFSKVFSLPGHVRYNPVGVCAGNYNHACFFDVHRAEMSQNLPVLVVCPLCDGLDVFLPGFSQQTVIESPLCADCYFSCFCKGKKAGKLDYFFILKPKNFFCLNKNGASVK